MSGAWVTVPLALDFGDWVGLVSLVLTLPTLAIFCVDIGRRVRQSSARIAFREFSYLISHPWHIILIVITLAFSITLAVRPPSQKPASLMILIPAVSGVLLLLSFFLMQSRRLAAEEVIRSMNLLVKRNPERASDGRSTAVRFDIDRLKAISMYSVELSSQIRRACARIIKEEVARLREERGHQAEVIELPGEDETIVIIVGATLDETGNFADQVRRRVQQEVKTMKDYAVAVDKILEHKHRPPSEAEEQEGIGTISAGVAANHGLAEVWFSDVSAAVKESKVRGRNKTVIHRQGQAPEVRSDFTQED